ncbi:hypothetical protein J6D24_01970 [Candidatus Saccharibacteria bacterium]|nr:hypothetical protein [Candidatus Saccharibacteria bacterium]
MDNNSPSRNISDATRSVRASDTPVTTGVARGVSEKELLLYTSHTKR